MSYWYILFVFTGREHHVASRINQHFCDELLTSFVPMRELFFKKSGKVHKRMITMFPGYVFIETDLCNADFQQYVRPMIETSADIIRILRYGDSDEITIREDECRLLKRLLNNNHCVKISIGFIEGDKILYRRRPINRNGKHYQES